METLDSHSEETPDTPPPTDAPPTGFTKWRNITAFWLFGLTNNYPYVIMLSAALDIIHKLEENNTPSGNNDTSIYNSSCTLVFNSTTNSSNYKPRSLCQKQGTAVILLADILPALFVKLLAPYWMHFIPYWIKVFGVVVLSMASFLLVALSTVEPLVLFGVACASIAAGFGEVAFLSFTAHYDKSTVVGWSSGTGAAGVAGALIYAGFRTFLSPKVTILIQICIPLIMLVTYLFVLGPRQSSLVSAPSHIPNQENDSQEEENEGEHSTDKVPLLKPDSSDTTKKAFDLRKVQLFNKEEAKHWVAHIKYIPHLFKYMVPLFLVYFSEYAINQGFFELLYNPNTHLGGYCLDQRSQYGWLQVMYQVGVFISRTSVTVIYIKYYWIFALLQVVNFVFFFCASIYLFLPSFWLTLFLVLYEGLLGGAVYVNAFYTISKEVPKIHLEFSMSVTSLADGSGITLAGVAAIFIHKYICRQFIGF